MRDGETLKVKGGRCFYLDQWSSTTKHNKCQRQQPSRNGLSRSRILTGTQKAINWKEPSNWPKGKVIGDFCMWKQPWEKCRSFLMLAELVHTGPMASLCKDFITTDIKSHNRNHTKLRLWLSIWALQSIPARSCSGKTAWITTPVRFHNTYSSWVPWLSHLFA